MNTKLAKNDCADDIIFFKWYLRTSTVQRIISHAEREEILSFIVSESMKIKAEAMDE